MLSPEQSRAARGWLGWSQAELAERAHVSISTIKDFERGERSPMRNNIEAMERALVAAGIRLLVDQHGKPIGITLADGDTPSAS